MFFDSGCPSDEDPICGSNDVTYRNQCLMLKVSCEQKLNLKVKAKGNSIYIRRVRS